MTAGDGDPEPTEPTEPTESESTSESEGSSETDDGDPECDEPSGGFMQPCSMLQPNCAPGLVCFAFQPPPMNDPEALTGYCSPLCESDFDCVWGSEDQCSSEDIVCIQLPNPRCGIECDIDDDCELGFVCNDELALCLPF